MQRGIARQTSRFGAIVWNEDRIDKADSRKYLIVSSSFPTGET